MQIEQRFCRTEIRVSKSGRTASGYVTSFNTLTKRNSGLPFRERCAPGCFKRALQTGDPLMLLNHDPTLILGRQSARTARFAEDTRGLAFECDLPDSPLGDNVRASLERGDLNGCSFGFCCSPDDPDCDSWDESEDEMGDRCIMRTLRSVSELRECSITPYPAYDGTSASVRSLFPEGVPLSVEIRSRLGRYGSVDAFYRSQAEKWKKIIEEDDAKARHAEAVRMKALLFKM